jgi:CBS domain-containing protein
MNQRDIVKTDNIIRVQARDTLSSALARLTSSHDAAFVFTADDKYIGIINPYYTLIQTSYPGATKVEHCVFHPPRVNIEDDLARIAQLMTESKIHYLPIFDGGKDFIGITTAHRLLKEIRNMSVAKAKIIDVASAKNGGVVSVYEDDSIDHALRLFKEHKISKLIVMDRGLKLRGILSYYDLIPNMVAPGDRESKTDRKHFIALKVKNFAKKTILTLLPNDTIAEAIDQILKHSMGSVVIVDRESHPVGIITTRDILNLLLPEKLRKPVEFTKKNLSLEHEKNMTDFVQYISKHIQKHKDIRSAKVIVEQEKNGVLFRVAVHILPEKGEVQVHEKESKDLEKIIKELKKFLRGKE